MQDNRIELKGSILAACLGIIGVVAFLLNIPVMGWIGIGGFIITILWLILTAPKPSTKTKGNGISTSAGIWLSGDCGGGSGGDGGASG